MNSRKCYQNVAIGGVWHGGLEEELGFLPFKGIIESYNKVKTFFN